MAVNSDIHQFFNLILIQQLGKSKRKKSHIQMLKFTRVKLEFGWSWCFNKRGKKLVSAEEIGFCKKMIERVTISQEFNHEWKMKTTIILYEKTYLEFNNLEEFNSILRQSIFFKKKWVIFFCLKKKSKLNKGIGGEGVTMKRGNLTWQTDIMRKWRV